MISNNMVMKGVGLIVPTYNAGDLWKEWLSAYESQTAKPETVLIVDSSSTDNTVKLAREKGFLVKVIPKSEFNHGGTRQAAINLLGDMKYVIFLTQDALLANKESLLGLIKPFENPAIAAVCGRQLPHIDATPISTHARYFNYPCESTIKGKADIPRLGLKTAFCSNSLAAYKISVLQSCGGFPTDVIFGEDTCLVSKMILDGYKLSYCADATVYHSHNYSFAEEFRRYFDIGALHSNEGWIQEQFGGAGGEGFRYVLSEIKYLGLRRIQHMPSVVIRTGLKLLGYKLGLSHRSLSISMRKKFSMNKKYWDTVAAK